MFGINKLERRYYELEEKIRLLCPHKKVKTHYNPFTYKFYECVVCGKRF
jgi:hypothetical protein